MGNNLVITNDGSHSIYNPKINETYHSKHGAIVEAEHVFIKNGFKAVTRQNLYYRLSKLKNRLGDWIGKSSLRAQH